MNTLVDKKVLDRVRKLLALAADGGATEHEAALAAERARQIMADNGISNATIEASGGEGEARTSDSRSGHTGKPWMRAIMRSLAEQAFVVVEWQSGRVVTNWGDDSKKRVPGKWQLWGRESAVVTVKLMHEYLVRTVDRVARERGTPTDELFKEAMGTRIAERIADRHDTAMREQARKARAAPPSGNTGNALVVVLEDYAQKENDLNNDLKNGWSPGTTAQRRAEYEAKQAAKAVEREKQRHDLISEGLSQEIVDMIMSGISRERAIQLASEPEHVESAEEAEKERRRRDRDDATWQARWEKRRAREEERLNSPSYRAGRKAGESVGLDAQVDKKETRKLS